MTQEKPAADPTVRIYNRSRRSFIHGDHKISPAAFAEVPRSVCDLWMKSFPGDVIEAATAQKELGGLGAELAETKLKLEKAEKALASHKSDPKGDKAKEALVEAQERILTLESELEKAQAAQSGI